jgi:predicted RNA-binding protein with PUA domain
MEVAVTAKMAPSEVRALSAADLDVLIEVLRDRYGN